MDTTETYIKMCEKLDKIQKLRNVVGSISEDVGEYKAGKYKLMEAGDVFYIKGKGIHISFGIAYPDSIWLPRQDQLQEMIGESPYTNIKNAMFSILDDLHKYVFTPDVFNEFIPVTMEQLWLAFVMKEKYNKIWDGAEWV